MTSLVYSPFSPIGWCWFLSYYLLTRCPLSSFEPEKEKHHRCPLLIDSTSITKGGIITILNRAIFFDVAQSFVTTILDRSIFSYISYCFVTTILNCAIADVTNGFVTAILNCAVVANMPHCFVVAVLNGAIGADIASGAIAARLDGLGINKSEREQECCYEGEFFHCGVIIIVFLFNCVVNQE